MAAEPRSRPWNIFMPYQILCESPGYLTGTTYKHISMLCVHEIITKENAQSANLPVIGYWQEAEADIPNYECFQHLNTFRFILTRKGTNNMILGRLEARSKSGSMVACPVVCVFFNPSDVGSSFVLLHCTKIKYNESSTDFKKNTTSYNESTIGILAKNVQKQQVQLEKDSSVKSLSGLHSSLHRIPGLFAQPLLLLSLLLIWIVCHIGHWLSLSVNYLHVCYLPLPKLVQNGSIINQLQERSTRYRRVLRLDRKDKFNLFLLYNCCGQQLMDTCLGLLMILLFLYHELANQISSDILDWADNIAKELITLVQWLMGSPAGLKLNAQLTQFLGHFFIYHIYLWTGYLTLLRNVMPSVIWACSLIGVLGVSAQICLVADVLSMLTLHIYCFYVYAAKIFSLQVYVMASLWRLFRGKKWNVLRSRVDSASYTIGQLLFGTSLFTMLLFLLPTTTLYYAVFTLLRLLVLAVQGLLSRMIATLTSTPVFTITLRLIMPKLVAGSVVFKVSHVPDDEKCLVLDMKTSQIPVQQLIHLTTSMMSPRQPITHSWGQFMSYLAKGKLIYPWIDVDSETKNKMK